MLNKKIRDRISLLIWITSILLILNHSKCLDWWACRNPVPVVILLGLIVVLFIIIDLNLYFKNKK